MIHNNWIDRDEEICNTANIETWEFELDKDKYVTIARKHWPKALKALKMMLEHTCCTCGEDEPTHDSNCMVVIAAVIRGGDF